jgi:predicted kinase/RimJ/RimL family protein N-acetyltransferase
MLIVVSGLPGTGKSTIADGISRARRAAVLSVDPVESAIARAGVARLFETGLAAYLVVEAAGDAILACGVEVVVDAVSSVEPARDLWRQLAARRGVPMRVIVCELGDAAVARERLASRDRGLAVGEPAWADHEARRGEWTRWPEEHLVLDALEPPASNVQRALAWLDARANLERAVTDASRRGGAPATGPPRPTVIRSETVGTPTIVPRAIDRSNFRAALELEVADEQLAWVAPTARYLTLCAYGGDWQPLGLYAGDEMVGFAMWARDPADGSHWIGGFLIDRRHQRRGLGRAALAAVIDWLRREQGAANLALSVSLDNAVARRLYASAGFVETGELESDELVARRPA